MIFRFVVPSGLFLQNKTKLFLIRKKKELSLYNCFPGIAVKGNHVDLEKIDLKICFGKKFNLMF